MLGVKIRNIVAIVDNSREAAIDQLFQCRFHRRAADIELL